MNWRRWLRRRRRPSESADEQPTQAELWGPAQLEEHARRLAQDAGGARAEPRIDLRQRLRSNAQQLALAHFAIATAHDAGRAITPAAEWLLDNFHIIADQATDIPRRLSPKLWRALPAATMVGAAAWPRIFWITREYLAHTDGEFNVELFARYLLSYQTITPLEMRELWALYPVVRSVLIDELRRLAVRMAGALAARGAADEFANRLLARAAETTGRSNAPAQLNLRLSHYQQPFVVQLAQRLQSMGEERQPILDQLADQLRAQGLTIDEAIQREHARRSASNLTVRNVMTSLRALAMLDWRALFEQTSKVELLLCDEPTYRLCDRRTRDRYRDCIEDMARASRRGEVDVATRVSKQLTGGDIGELLIGPRRRELEIAVGFQPPITLRVRRWLIARAGILYGGMVLALTASVVALSLRWGLTGTSVPVASFFVLGTLALFPGSEVAIAFINRICMRQFPPRHLPRLALQQGLSAQHKTLVVIPVILSTPRDAIALARDLQVHALANPDPDVRFALLSDWTDSPTLTHPDDESILEAAIAAIAALNERDRDPPATEPRFYLFHRRRQWNSGENCFMGWERKRGKLAELNRLLLGVGPTSFINANAKTAVVPVGVRYVLTLDADTRLPLGAVRDLVGVAAHPLNRPVFDPLLKRVVRGYAVVQPRVTALLPTPEERSAYREIITGGSGLDPYAAAMSDLHQDVFGEGLFTGKGLYDVAIFDAALQGRVPENTLLSHDLFEGLFARCALLSDIELFEDFPSHSEVAAARAHRWIRGDWQLLPWILGQRGRLPPLGRWKMLDNLRRSLLPATTLALLVASLLMPAARPARWLALVVMSWTLPALVNLLARVLTLRSTVSVYTRLREITNDLRGELARALVALGLLAQNSWISIDAIGRVLVRLTITRRKRLEWVTAAQLKARSNHALNSFVWSLKSASIIVLTVTALILWINPASLLVVTPLLILWWLTPLIAHYLSKPFDAFLRDETPLPRAQQLMRGVARQTWRFFETFVTPQEHHLPPDNFQESPLPVIAHRSSPTNFGLYLLSCVAARDFGWLGLQDLTMRLSATLDTLEQLPRYNGHFLNWYDTRSLAPLEPRYVSTVDSGNLAGHLLTLRQAIVELKHRPLLSQSAFSGPSVTLDFCADARIPELDASLRQLRILLLKEPTALHSAAQLLHEASDRTVRLEALAQRLGAEKDPPQENAAMWAQLLNADVATHLRDLDALLPGTDGGRPEIVQQRWTALHSRLPRDANLLTVVQHQNAALTKLRSWLPTAQSAADQDACATLIREVQGAIGVGTGLLDRLTRLSERCVELVEAMQFGFLFDRSRGLLSIGYRVTDNVPDAGYYDLLASESRLASFVAIAKGDVPRSHWMRLGRGLTGGAKQPVLASWSGSMFEYLMPGLVMREPRNSLLDQSSRQSVVHQMEFGAEHALPWGVSESAYNVRDRAYTYQYSSFGLPALGLKRGLGADRVVAPYATALAAVYRPEAAAHNFRALDTYGARGRYGFYEAIDFTTQRLPNDTGASVIRAFMAHHQGMTLVALDNVLNRRIMQNRFHGEPMIQAAELLLQERSARFVDVPEKLEAEPHRVDAHDEQPELERCVTGFATRTPVTHLLSNRHYSVMLTDSGAGYSRYRELAVTRWREDTTQDAYGSFVYLHDDVSGEVWSAGFQPTAAIPDEYEVLYKEERVAIKRRDGSLTTLLEVIVAAGDDGELRRVSLRNDGSRSREIELTSYAEVVLAAQRADIAHPGFSNLFVSTEYVHEMGVLLATRRPRSSGEAPIWATHVLSTSQAGVPHLEYETDRQRFLGRGRTARSPLVIEERRPLSNTAGAVLDPIFSLRTRVRIGAGETVTVTFATLVGPSREHALALASKYSHAAMFEHCVDFAWTFARAELYYLQSDLREARLFQILAASLLFSNRLLRTGSDVIGANQLSVAHLWRLSISGDRPIMVIRCRSNDEQGFIRQCLRAQEFLRTKGVCVDVVILNELQYSYIQDLQDNIERCVRTYAVVAPSIEGEERGTVFTLRADRMSSAERGLLLAVARVVLQPEQGSLAEQLDRPDGGVLAPANAVRAARFASSASADTTSTRPTPALEFFNGLGGFAADGHEYVILLGPGKTTPAPWANVMANETFGSLVSEQGSMCTWSLNSRENQLTPWSNDPVSDPSGEAFFIRDEASQALWSPTPLPIRLRDAHYEVRHGQGYSQFLLTTQGVASDLQIFVTRDDPVKLGRLRLTNQSPRRRRLSIATYVEWTLGSQRAASAPNIVTEIDAHSGAMFARNALHNDFGARVAFCDLGARQQFWTGSRREFLGRNGDLASPLGMRDVAAWSRRVGAGFDPCGAFSVTVELDPGASEEFVFTLGQAESAVAARELVLRYRQADSSQVLRQVKLHWDNLLNGVQIRTPDRPLDILFNRWLLYQTVSCRLWGRAGFYQASGAYGFRDQLQDSMALAFSNPALTRAHLLRAAARQFVQGDVQHWWHPPSGRGVRTHFSDDRVWLPFAVSQYLDVTQDDAVLEAVVPFIDGRLLPDDKEDEQFEPTTSTQTASLYEHCARALDVSLQTGVHALPLMGGGDWNDGMNRVGAAGRGESVWLAWFLITNLRQFAPLAQRRGDTERANRWREHAQALAQACELHAWDGAWYRRAFFDDGSALGSAANVECRIDSLAQSWAVISGAADAERATKAMASVDQYLVRGGDGLVLLFTPPFELSMPDPGYVKAYLPGLRENGGQYTHAAIWVLIAQAVLGDRAQVGALLEMLNPVRRTLSSSGVQAYRVEPYVIAADIYSSAPHARRGGWTWYTGASGWFYQAVLESVLGVKIRGERLTVSPCMPPHWNEFEVSLTHDRLDYLIQVVRVGQNEDVGVALDGVACVTGSLPLLKDGRQHVVRVSVA